MTRACLAPAMPTTARPADRTTSASGNGVERTLRALMTSVDPAADDLLLIAASSSSAPLRVGAIRALARRPTPAGHGELIQRWQELADDARATLVTEAERPALAASIEALISGANTRRASQAIRFADECSAVATIPVLARRALATSGEEASEAAAICLKLSRVLRARIDQGPQGGGIDYSDPAFARRSAVIALQEALERYNEHRLDTLIDALLETVSHADEALLEALNNTTHQAHVALIQRLQHAQGDGVAKLLQLLLCEAKTPRSACEAFVKRTDLKTLDYVLGAMASRVNQRATENLKQIDNFAWLAEDNLGELLRWKEQTLAGAVRVAAASSVSRRSLVTLIEYVLAAGAIEPEPLVGALARRAAADAIAVAPSHLVARAIQLALEDSDPKVAATAVRLIRSKKLPGAERTLVSLLDHEDEVVRRSAQSSLKGVTYSKLRDLVGTLREDQLRRAGAIVGKADPLAVEQLNAELRAGAAQRRLEAIEMAEMLGLVDDVLDRLIDLAADSDSAVRCEAARVLGNTAGSKAVVRCLATRLKDPSIAVRSAAEKSLVKLDRMEHAVMMAAGELP